jgi:signal transduction histidine kinase
MDQTPVESPFLSTVPTRRIHRIAAILVVVLSLIAAAIILPFANRLWFEFPSFIPADDACLVVLNFITAMLLIGQFRQLGAPSLLLMSCAYLFFSFIASIHLLVYPGVLSPTGLLHANDQTAAWLYLCWHLLFPVFALTYGLIVQSRFDARLAPRHIGPAIVIAVVFAIGLTYACLLLSTVGAAHLPKIIAGDRYSANELAGNRPLLWPIVVATLIVLYVRTRARRVLDLWLCVVLFAGILEFVMTAIASNARYSFGWYAGHVYGVLAASVVLSALIIETVTLYARVIRVLAEMRAQSLQLAKSEDALRQAQKMEAIGQLTGGLAHDFNNLLTVIIGSLDLIQSDPADAPRTARLAQQAMAAAGRAEQLTKQLLTFARRQMIRPKTVDLNRVIRDFAELLQTALGGTIELHLKLDENISAVRIDPAQFEAAMLNLAVNARDAMNGVGRISVETSNVTLNSDYAANNPGASPGNYVLVSVSDTGAGMDAETLSRVFEPFFTTKEVGKGSGLGLSQVYGFVKSAGGLTKISSKPGNGTQVNIYLPSAVGETLPAGPVGSFPSSARTVGGETILVVDDDPGVLTEVSESLTHFGYAVLTAANPAQALDRIRAESRIDLLFSDVMTAGDVTGVQLAVEARRLKPTIKILLASGSTADAFVSEDDLPPDIQIIAKPYPSDALAERLRGLLDAADP